VFAFLHRSEPRAARAASPETCALFFVELTAWL